MIKVVPYSPEHLKAIQVRPECGDKPESVIGVAVTFMLEDKPVAILGGHMIARGVGQGWSLISMDATKVPVSLHKNARLFIRYVEERFALQRIQISVRCTFAGGWRWAEGLGFACEGIMRSYASDGGDCWLFARIK